ncbi:MAG: hypothetical protein E7289_05930 [Lachnospiraceae bacterium]|nr:hypothetical protein [Lachnospiraceae bacterium]
MKKEKFIQKIIEKTKDTLQELNFDTYDIIIHPDNHLFMIGVNGNPICVCHIEEARQYHKENDIKMEIV